MTGARSASPGGTPLEWNARLSTHGEVVWPQRQRRLVIRLAIIGLFVLNTASSLFNDVRDDEFSGFFAGFRVLTLTLWLLAIAWTVWQLVTGRPVVTVDHDGIRMGRSKRGRLAWGEVARIADPIGIPGLRSVHIFAEGGARRIAVLNDNVEDLDAFAEWLRRVHQEHQDRDLPAGP